MRRTWRSVAAVALLALVALGACSNDGDSSASKSAGGSRSEALAAPAGGAAAPKQDAAAPAADREITYTASLVVRVADAERASERATTLAEAAKGYLAGQQADLTGQRQSTLTIRVPSASFRTVMAQLAGLGRVQDKGIESTDVTDKVVDLRGRLESQQASATRLRTLLAGAGSTADVVAFEQELAKRESEIESLQGQLRVLDDQVALATITVRFTEKAEPPRAEPDDGAPGFVDALRAGGGTLLAIGRGALLVLGYLLPFVPILAVASLGWRWWRRRHPKGPSTPTPAWTPPPAAAPADRRPPPPAPPAAG